MLGNCYDFEKYQLTKIGMFHCLFVFKISLFSMSSRNSFYRLICDPIFALFYSRTNPSLLVIPLSILDGCWRRNLQADLGNHLVNNSSNCCSTNWLHMRNTLRNRVTVYRLLQLCEQSRRFLRKRSKVS